MHRKTWGMSERERETYEDGFPNPEDNPDFELFSERKQDEIDARFQAGIALGQRKRRDERLRRKAVKRAREYEREHGPAPRKAPGFAKLGEVARVR